MSDTTRAPVHDVAALLDDFAEDVSQQLQRLEEALDALTLLVRSARREAARARAAPKI